MIRNALIAVALFCAAGWLAPFLWAGACWVAIRREDRQRRRMDALVEARRAQIRLVDQPPASLWQKRRRPFDYERD